MSVGDYCRAEIEVVAEEEWIVTMDDFLRRRTRLGQLERPADLRADPGVVEASRILLSEHAAAAWSGGQVDVTTKSNP
jgi:glycerol-3-phosphate dehydrogenase